MIHKYDKGKNVRSLKKEAHGKIGLLLLKAAFEFQNYGHILATGKITLVRLGNVFANLWLTEKIGTFNGVVASN